MRDQDDPFEVKVEVSVRHDWTDVYITHNGRDWSGMTLRSYEEIEAVYRELEAWLYSHEEEG